MACRNIEYLRTFSVTPLSVWLALHMQVLYLREYNCKENEGISTIPVVYSIPAFVQRNHGSTQCLDF